MAELTVEDLSAYTGGRIADDDAAAADAVAAALAAARRWCGWHVSPVIDGDELVVDGSGCRGLALPTRKLLELTTVAENGVDLNLDTIDVSAGTGIIWKYPTGVWTSRAGGVAVTITHGFTEDEAADWRRGVLRLADSMMADSTAGQRDSSDLLRKKVDDVEYQWADRTLTADEMLGALFSNYRILPPP